MFSRHHNDPTLPDHSVDLRDEQDWQPGPLQSFDFPLDISALAIEPQAGLLAAGTASGSVHLFGGPSVHTKFTLPEPIPVKFLHFSPSTYFLVCLDGNSSLHLWNLLEFGKPRLVASALFDPVNSITVSPSHSHVFLSMQKGEIRTYDLLCRRKSPYIAPDMWKLYEDQLAKSGVPSLVPPTPSTAVETVIHPRNLNLLFVAYASGVILTDLSERSTVRAYELILPPGAPGGAGYGDPDILTHRRCSVTCISVHPTGHMFAAGYADGSIAFWATEDDSKPLLVRTLDADDVNIVDGPTLETHLDSGASKSGPLREPIFKLAWSGYSNSADPRGGETTLAVLGGLYPSSPLGLTVALFPPFNPSDPPSDHPLPQDISLHPHFRDAMKRSLTPVKSFYYHTSGVVQDFLLKPKPQGTPHYAGNFDPDAILFILENPDGSRTVSAYEYPPPGFLSSTAIAAIQPEQNNEDVQSDTTSPQPASAPGPANASRSPRPPAPIGMNLGLGSGVVFGELFRVQNDVYAEFTRTAQAKELGLLLDGGRAYPDETHTKEAKLSKFQPHRILSLCYQDLSIRYFDISTQLLIPKSATLDVDFPNPIPELTIRLGDLFGDVVFTGALSCRPQDVAIESIHTAPQALECAIVLKSGEVIVYSSTPHPAAMQNQTDPCIILLTHLRNQTTRMSPFFVLAPNRGHVEACAISEAGFLAVSYSDGSLVAVDMRGPTSLLSLESGKKPKRTSILPVHRPGGSLTGSLHDADAITSLAWTFSPLEKDASPSLRLVTARRSGVGDVYSFTTAGRSWVASGDPISVKSLPDPIPGGIFVLEGKTGDLRKADRTRLAALYNRTSASTSVNDNTNILVIVGKRGVRCLLNLTGDRLAKEDWSTRSGSALTAQVVDHNGSCALIVHTDRHDALVYSLPHLEHIQTVQIPSVSPLPLSIDESGDFIAWNPHPTFKGIQSIVYGSFFAVRRPTSLPDLDFRGTRKPVPAQPQPVPLGPQSYLGSWFSFNQTKGGNEIDELLGGPDRPIPEVPQEPGGPGVGEGIAGTAANIAAGAAAMQTGLFNKLTSAMAERGQVLSGLEEQFNSLEEGSRGMLNQAKRLAAQQTAKGWFGF